MMSKPAETDSDVVTPAVIVTVTLTVSFAGTQQIIDRVLLLDWFVNDVVHVIVELVIGGVHTSWTDVFVV